MVSAYDKCLRALDSVQRKYRIRTFRQYEFEGLGSNPKLSLFGLHLIIPQKILKRWNSGATPASSTAIRIDKPCPDLFHRIHELPNDEVQYNIK